MNGGVGSGEAAEPRRDQESTASRLLMGRGRGDMKVKGEALRVGRDVPMERSTMLEGGDWQSKLLPKASRLD